MTKTNFDIMIVGGGVVGLTCASLLSDSTLTIAICDNHLKDEALTHEYDLRVFAITPASEKLFELIGIWDDITSVRASPYKHMHVWDKEGGGDISFSAKEVLEHRLGHIVEQKVLNYALMKSLKTKENVTFLCPIQLSAIDVDKDTISLMSDKGKYTSKLVIGADGGQSWVRQQSDIEFLERPYDHHAIVAMITTEYSHKKTARQQFMKTGPLAFLPLKDEYTSSIVWSSVPDKSTSLMALDDKMFCQELTNTCNVLGRVHSVSKRVNFPLILRHAKNYVSNRVALIGDAAHTVHPLAGQGLNLGLLDANSLAKGILNAKMQGRDFGRMHTLRYYERQRRGHNQSMIWALDGFKNVFCNDASTAKTLGNLGLNLTNKLPFIKKQFIKNAMGESQLI